MITKSLLESVLNEEHLIEGVEVKGHGEYEFTNGRKPTGRGLWMFGLGPKSHHEDSNGNLIHDRVFSHTCTFSEAQKAAKKHAQSLGHKEIRILT